MKTSYKPRKRTIFHYSLSWLIPLIMSIFFFFLLNINHDASIRNLYVLFSFIVIFPSFFLFIINLISDYNTIFIIDDKNLIKISKKKKIVIAKNNIQSITRTSSSFEDSYSGYGTLYFLGGSFYYYKIIDQQFGNSIRVSCLMIDDFAFKEFDVIEDQNWFPL